MSKEMNADTQYLVNRSNVEHPAWECARWKGPCHVPGFHHMALDESGVVVVKHISAIKPVKTDAKPAEEAMLHLLEHYQLVPEARKLITAALQAQASGTPTNFTI